MVWQHVVALLLVSCVRPAHAAANQATIQAAASRIDILDDWGGMAHLGDLNGDGLATEVAAGAAGAGTSVGTGSVEIFQLDPLTGERVGGFASIGNGTGGMPSGVLRAGDRFGCDVEFLGDFDGDGVAAELAVGAYLREDEEGFWTDSGAVFLLWLNPSDYTVRKYAVIQNGVDGFENDLAANDGFGISLAAPRNPGFGFDLAVGLWGSDGDYKNQVWVLALNSTTGRVLSYTKLGDGLGGLPAGLLVTTDNFGGSLAFMGDLSGGGLTLELAVGARQDGQSGAILGYGAVYILSLESSGSVNSYSKIMLQEAGVPQAQFLPGTLFGRSLAFIGQIPGHGTTDVVLAVGASLDSFDSQQNQATGAIWLVWIDRSTKGVTEYAKLTDGYAGIEDQMNGLYCGGFTTALGHTDGSAGTMALLTKHDAAAVLVRLRQPRPVRPAELSEVATNRIGQQDPGQQLDVYSDSLGVVLDWLPEMELAPHPQGVRCEADGTGVHCLFRAPSEYSAAYHTEFNGTLWDGRTLLGFRFNLTLLPPRVAVASIAPSHVQLSRNAAYNFTITGSNFGNVLSHNTSVVVGGNACEEVVWQSSSRIDCVAVPANFSDHDVTVAVRGIPLPSQGGIGVLGYDPLPQIIVGVPRVLQTSGGERLTLYGTGLAAQGGAVVRALVGAAECSNMTLASASTIECVSPAGTGTAHSVWLVTSTGYMVESLLGLDYQPPTVAAASPAVAFADASVQYNFTLTGSGFGVADSGQVESVVVAGRSCPAVKRLSDTRLVCSGVSGPWDEAKLVSVVVSGQRGAGHVISFHDPPSVADVSPPTLPTAGGNVTITGSGFGDSIDDILGVRVGDAVCGSIRHVSSSQLRCWVPPGVGADLNVSVSVRLNGDSDPAPLLSFAPPVIHSVAVVDGEGVAVSELYAGESRAVVISFGVSNAGADVNGVRVWLQSPVWTRECLDLVRVRGGPSELTQLECRNVSVATAPADTDHALDLHLTVGRQSTVYPGTLDIVGRPSLSLVTPVTPNAGMPMAGNQLGDVDAALLRVLGQSLGRTATDVLAVDVDGVPCPVVRWQSSSQILVGVPPGVGVGSTLRVTTRGGQADMVSGAFSYELPVVTGIDPAYALTGNGSSSFEIRGTGFGLVSAHLGTVQVGGQPCPAATWVSSVLVRCSDMSWALWSSRSVAVTIGGQSSLENALFEPVGVPVVTAVSPRVVDEGTVAVVVGEGFGYELGDVASATVGGEPCLQLDHLGPTTLQCTIPPPSQAMQDLAATDPTTLSNVSVVVTTAGGQRSVAVGHVAYASAGRTPTAVPSELLAWRPVGQPNSFSARWAVPTDGDDADGIRSFDLEVAAAPGGGAVLGVQTASVDAAEGAGLVTTTEDGWRVFRYAGVLSRRLSVWVRVRAVNAAGFGEWSKQWGPMTANCPTDAYLQTQLNVTQWGCSECPTGSFCGGTNASTVTALPGFWRVPWSEARLGFAKCSREASCLGYTEPSPAPAATNASGGNSSVGRRRLAPVRRRAAEGGSSLQEALAQDDVPSAVDPTLWGDPGTMEQCATGYTGTMCTTCTSGFARWGGAACRACQKPLWVGLAVAGGGVLLLVIVSFLTLSAFNSADSKKSVGTAAIKLLLSHLQTVGIAAAFRLRWPPSVSAMFAGMNVASSVSSEVIGLDCLLPSATTAPPFFGKAAVVLALPLILVAFAAAFWIAVGSCCPGGRRGASVQSAQRPPSTTGPVSMPNPALLGARGLVVADVGLTGLGAEGLAAVSAASKPGKAPTAPPAATAALTKWNKLLTTAIVILFLVHMSVTQTSLQLLTCTDVEPADGAATATGGGAQAAAGPDIAGCDSAHTHRRLLQDLEVCCYDKNAQRSMYGLGIPGLLVYAFGIPITAALLLACWRQSLANSHTRATVGFLYAGFKDEAYYWESVVMLRKVMVAVIAVSLEPMGVTLQTYAAIVLLFFLTLVHARVWPYEERALNLLEFGALVTAFVTFECGLFLTDDSASATAHLMASLCILGCNGVFILVAVAVIAVDKLNRKG